MFEINLIEDWDPLAGFGEPTYSLEFNDVVDAIAKAASIIEKGENDWHVEVLDQKTGETILGLTRSNGNAVVDGYRRSREEA